MPSRRPPTTGARLVVCGLLFVGFGAVAACSSRGGSSEIDRSDDAACELLDRLAATADSVEAADVADPEAFTTALETAVLEYVTTLDSLIAAAPPSLTEDLEEVRGLVEQYRFSEAAEARVPIDDWADTACTGVA